MTDIRLLVGLLFITTSLALAPASHSAPPKKKTGLKLSSSRPGARRKATPTAQTKAARRRTRQPQRGLTYTVTATVYEAVAAQTDAEPAVTADNSRIRPHYGSRQRWLALSRDLLRPWGGQFEYGDRVRVQGISAQLDGIYTVHDTMNQRRRRALDVLVHSSENLNVLAKGVKIQKVAH